MVAAVLDSLVASRRPPWTQSTSRGYLAGVAPGLVSMNGVATARTVLCLHRATLLPIARTFADLAGQYVFHDLPCGEEYSVVGMDWSGTYNDVIVSRARPEPYDVQSVTGAFAANNATHALDGALDVFGGMDPYTITVASGSAPPGLAFAVVVGTTPVFAATGRYVVATGTTSAGAYAWDLTITAANASSQTIACTATFE